MSIWIPGHPTYLLITFYVIPIEQYFIILPLSMQFGRIGYITVLYFLKLSWLVLVALQCANIRSQVVQCTYIVQIWI